MPPKTSGKAQKNISKGDKKKKRKRKESYKVLKQVHWYLIEGHVHHEQLRERHIRENRRRGIAFGTLQQAVDHHFQGNSDRCSPASPRRVGQTRRVWGHQGCHQVHQQQVSKWGSFKRTHQSQVFIKTTKEFMRNEKVKKVLEKWLPKLGVYPDIYDFLAILNDRISKSLPFSIENFKILLLTSAKVPYLMFAPMLRPNGPSAPTLLLVNCKSVERY